MKWHIVYIDALNDYYIVNEYELCRGDDIIYTETRFDWLTKNFDSLVAADQNKYWKD